MSDSVAVGVRVVSDDGSYDGSDNGFDNGSDNGSDDGSDDGSYEDSSVGERDSNAEGGARDGSADFNRLGDEDGVRISADDGGAVSVLLSDGDGGDVGVVVDVRDSVAVGVRVGSDDGSYDGSDDGSYDFSIDGWEVGVRESFELFRGFLVGKSNGLLFDLDESDAVGAIVGSINEILPRLIISGISGRLLNCIKGVIAFVNGKMVEFSPPLMVRSVCSSLAVVTTTSAKCRLKHK